MKRFSALLVVIAAFLATPAFAQTSPATVVGPAPNVATWDFSAADVTKYGVTGFLIERKAELCNASPSVAKWGTLATVGPTVRSYTDLTAVAPNSYCYRGSAINPTGATISGTADKTDTYPLPPAPTNFKVTTIEMYEMDPNTSRFELRSTEKFAELVR